MKREGKVKTKAEISDSDGEGEGGQDDEAYARQLQSEYNSYGSRPSRTTSTRPKAKKAVVKKKKRSAAVVDSGDEDGEPKKKRAAPNTAFNKDLILRWVMVSHINSLLLGTDRHQDRAQQKINEY